MNTFRFYYQQLLKTFRDLSSKRSLWVFGYDLVYWIIAWIGSSIIARVLENKVTSIPFDPYVTSPEHIQNLQGPLTSAQEAVFTVLLIYIFYLVVLFLLWALSRSLLWSVLLQKKWKPLFWFKMVLTQIMWSLIFVLPFILLFFIFVWLYNNPFFATTISFFNYVYLMLMMVIFFAMVFIYHHFTVIMYYLFTKYQTFLSVLRAYPVGFNLLKKAWKPNVILFVVVVIVSIISTIFNIFPQPARTYLIFFLMLIIVVFFRIYYVDLLHTWKVK